MKTLTKETAAQTIQLLCDSLVAGLSAWESAGTQVIKLLDDFEMSLEEIAHQAKSEFVTVSILAQFERIGRKQVLPRLLVSEYPASTYLQKLPLSEQERLVDGSVDMVVLRDGKTDVLSVGVRDLSRQQCKQVFDKSGVRSLGAQRAWIEEKTLDVEITNIKSANTTPWIVRSGKVLFRESCEVTRHDLALILAQLS